MNTEAQKILVLIAVAALMLAWNLKAGDAVTKLISYAGLLAAVGAAGWLLVGWLFL